MVHVRSADKAADHVTTSCKGGHIGHDLGLASSDCRVIKLPGLIQRAQTSVPRRTERREELPPPPHPPTPEPREGHHNDHDTGVLLRSALTDPSGEGE